MRIVPQPGGSGVVADKLGDARPNQPQGQIGGCRARSAIEAESNGAVRRAAILCDISGVIDRCRTFAGLVIEGEGACRCGIRKLSARKIDRVLGNRIPREQAQHAFALFALTLLGALLLGVLRGLMLWTLLRTRSRSGTSEKQ